MSEGKQLLAVALATLAMITGVVATLVISGNVRHRAELETRRECFASNERIAKTWAAAQATGYRRPDSLSDCSWR